MTQETAFETASSGTFQAPGKAGSVLQLHREGVEGLVANGLDDLTPWEYIKVVNVYQSHAEWVIKKQCECGAGMDTYYNPECAICDGFGIAEGVKVSIPHDIYDDQMIDWYINLEGMTGFWARQSGPLTRLRDKTPVFNLDIPRVVFHCISKKDKVRPEAMYLPDSVGGGGPIRKRAIAYHDEFRKELVKIKLEKEASTNAGY